MSLLRSVSESTRGSMNASRSIGVPHARPPSAISCLSDFVRMDTNYLLNLHNWGRHQSSDLRSCVRADIPDSIDRTRSAEAEAFP